VKSSWTDRIGLITRRSEVQILPPPPRGRKRKAKLVRKHLVIAVPASPVRTALALLAIDLYAARDVVGHGDRSRCLTLVGTAFELRTPPGDGVATDGQVG
jgi:hypothetical protein